VACNGKVQHRGAAAATQGQLTPLIFGKTFSNLPCSALRI
jgi:hypothetical protein